MTGAGSREAIAAEGAERLMRRCALLAQCTDRPGEILRTFLSPAMDEAHRTMRPWIEGAGMKMAVDWAGNLRGVLPAGSGESPRLLIGSHLDTVPNAGAYDGVLGVLMGLALVEAAAAAALPFAVEVIGFSDEEGTRFGVPFLGSRAVAGELTPSLTEARDSDGISVAEALQHFRRQRPELVETELLSRSDAWLEFHIEQGPALESRGLALGIVEAIAGQSRSHINFRGRAAHAGATPMNLRRDAMAAAAEWMVQVEAIAARTEGAVATVGQIQVQPGAVNVIPGEVRCSLDIRHADDAGREAVLGAILDDGNAIAGRRGVQMEAAQYHAQPAVVLDPAMVRMAERAAEHAGCATVRMTSGAGHDAMVMAPHVPSAMVFLRNPGGVSHHPDERVLEEDVAAAIRMGLCFFEEFAARLMESGGEHGA